MNEGYPEQKELQKIKDWDVYDFINLIDFVRDLWNYNKHIKCYWHNKNKTGYTMRLELLTCGWSGNESIVDSLLENNVFKMLWYAEWHRGGKYVFEIDPVNVGYKLVSDFCRENKITRQAIYKQKRKYLFIKVSEKIVFVKSANSESVSAR